MPPPIPTRPARSPAPTPEMRPRPIRVTLIMLLSSPGTARVGRRGQTQALKTGSRRQSGRADTPLWRWSRWRKARAAPRSARRWQLGFDGDWHPAPNPKADWRRRAFPRMWPVMLAVRCRASQHHWDIAFRTGCSWPPMSSSFTAFMNKPRGFFRQNSTTIAVKQRGQCHGLRHRFHPIPNCKKTNIPAPRTASPRDPSR